jgi:hypothetical protein
MARLWFAPGRTGALIAGAVLLLLLLWFLLYLFFATADYLPSRMCVCVCVCVCMYVCVVVGHNFEHFSRN